MFDIGTLLRNGITTLLVGLLEDVITFFATILANIMGTSIMVFNMPLVINGIFYTQVLAITMLSAKVLHEIFQTYILYQSGDPDADPTGLLIRTGQSIAIIATMPWIIEELIFKFGTKVATDVANLSTGTPGALDSILLSALVQTGVVIPIAILIVAFILICTLVIAFQSTIRGANLALMTVLGSIIALNLTSSNRGLWSAWLREVIIICTAHAIQIFMFQGVLALMTTGFLSSYGFLLVGGWMWATVKSPKFVRQIAYSTGVGGAVGGGMRQAGSSFMMRKMMMKK
ncbi:hypothetical protein JYT99_00610 [bacterium AH-315-E09]|nr:hypothetical protein [Alkaliphilus sp. AH-315-G20]MBN4074411.1 hypothetical protein [bacterium AH-315-E09]